MSKIVKAKNLLAFKIWFEKLGYKVETRACGFVARTSDRFIKARLHHVLAIDHENGNQAAFELGQEFEMHLASPNLSDAQNSGLVLAMANQIGKVA